MAVAAVEVVGLRFEVEVVVEVVAEVAVEAHRT